MLSQFLELIDRHQTVFVGVSVGNLVPEFVVHFVFGQQTIFIFIETFKDIATTGPFIFRLPLLSQFLELIDRHQTVLVGVSFGNLVPEFVVHFVFGQQAIFIFIETFKDVATIGPSIFRLPLLSQFLEFIERYNVVFVDICFNDSTPKFAGNLFLT